MQENRPWLFTASSQMIWLHQCGDNKFVTLPPKFQTGGTLIPDRSVYVKRSEDEKFLQLTEEQKAWINLYGCRTMGKSSLYAQYLDTLKARGIKPVVVDVASQIGFNQTTPRDWVYALGEAAA